MKLAVMALVFAAITAGAETRNNLDVSAGINHEEFDRLFLDKIFGGQERRYNTAAPMKFFDPHGDIRFTQNRLPHWQQSGAVYFVTFRLADALPEQLLEQWQDERDVWLKFHPLPWSADVEEEYIDGSREQSKIGSTLAMARAFCAVARARRRSQPRCGISMERA